MIATFNGSDAELMELYRSANEKGWTAGYAEGKDASIVATRRERIATAALQGMLSGRVPQCTAKSMDHIICREYAEVVLLCADALIAALDKETP